MSVQEISVQQLNKLRNSKADFLLLDVRNSQEYAICNLGGYSLPLPQLAERINELNPEQLIIIHCHGTQRSRQAAEFLTKQGFKKIYNLQGGIAAWINEINTSTSKY
jgi:rhodanese-related sulfurtransferase